MFRRSIFACSLALVACACSVPANAPGPVPNASTAAPEPAPVAVPIVTVGAITRDAMYAAEALYNVPAHAYVTADARGFLPVAVKAKVKPLLVKGYGQLGKARGYYEAYTKFGKITDAVGFWNTRDELEETTAEANKLLPKPGS